MYEERATYVDVNVFIDSTEKIASGSFDISYDPSTLTITDTNVQTGNAITGYLNSAQSDNTGTVSLSFAAAEGKALNGTLLTLKTRVSKAKSETVLDMKNVHLYLADGTELDPQIVDGAIKPFDGKTVDYTNTVPKDKVWKITLSKPYDPKTLNDTAVVVKRGYTDVPVSVRAINSTTFEVTAKDGYLAGKHTLDITSQLRSAKGSKLMQPVRQTFTVK